MQWDDVRLFLALARSGSARRTGADLGVSHTTVSRRARQLEASLGARLFDRDAGGYRLTVAGEALIESAERAEDALLEAERTLQGRDAELSGEIRLTTPGIIATHLIMPEMAAFSRLYPDIDLNILISADLFDIGRREADIALRLLQVGKSPPGDLVGRQLATAASGFYATERYLAEHDLSDPGSGARWIGWNDEERFPGWVRSSPFPHLPAYGRLNDPLMQVAAVQAGMGIAVLPCFVADDAEGIVRIPGCDPYPSYDIWLLSHPDLRDAARLRTFRAFVAEVFRMKHPVLVGAMG
jgi:DNA-binding transcriptional LysR family regulator